MFVHFPVALLVVYTLCEIVRFKKITDFTWWTPLKIFLLALGVLSSYATFLTGLIAEDAIPIHSVMSQVAWIHKLSAFTTVGLATVLLGIYLLALKKINFAEKIAKSWVMALGAIILLLAVFVTGALGASLVYGQNTDPLVHFVYGIFIKK